MGDVMFHLDNRAILAIIWRRLLLVALFILALVAVIVYFWRL